MVSYTATMIIALFYSMLTQQMGCRCKIHGAIDGVDDPFESTVGFDLTCFFAEDEMIRIMMPDDIHDGLSDAWSASDQVIDTFPFHLWPGSVEIMDELAAPACTRFMQDRL